MGEHAFVKPAERGSVTRHGVRRRRKGGQDAVGDGRTGEREKEVGLPQLVVLPWRGDALGVKMGAEVYAALV
jgi:hypothetical protein